MILHRLTLAGTLASLVFLVACDEGADTRRVQADVGYNADVGAEIGCHGPEDCAAGELCVASNTGDRVAGECVAQCSIEAGDVCPVGERCAPVIDAQGSRAAACVPGVVASQDTWQRCDSREACGTGEDCLYLDDVLGARCVPSCNPDQSCRNAGDVCALHWEGPNGQESGCVRSCESDEACGRGWRCELGASIAGLCVR